MSIENRIKRLEADICPSNRKYGVLTYSYRLSYSTDWNNYMRDSKPVGYIRAVLEWGNGKILRMINTGSEEGKKILTELGYQKIA